MRVGASPGHGDMMTTFDPARFLRFSAGGHNGRLGLAYRTQGPGWIELELPPDPSLAGEASGAPASGAIFTLMDMATSMSVWMCRGRFVPQATLDLRVDHVRRPEAGTAVIGRGECYAIAEQVAFVRGLAYQTSPADPVAHVAATFMLMEPRS